MAHVSLRGVSKSYGAEPAVRQVSFDVADGEFMVLLGPSGSGKSTLLKLIAGIEALDEGEIWVDGSRVDEVMPRWRDVAMVFQSYALYPHMSVEANLCFPLKCAGLSRAEISERVGAAAEMLELGPLLARRPGQLSGGQQQRVALGRAIVRKPKAFLMDEPLSNLDAKLRARTRLELTRLHDRLGATTIYVTHDQVEALTMAHRVAVLHHGHLHQVAPPEVVYEHPADLVVADFLGSPPMNCLRARIAWADTQLRVSGPGFHLAFPRERLDASLRAGWAGGPSEVVFGVRPEYVGLGDCGGGPSLGAIVERSELIGSERIVHLSCEAATLAARVPARSAPAPGTRVELSVAPEGVRLFDPANGLCLAPQGK